MVEKQFSVCDQPRGITYIFVPKGEQAEGDVNELHVLYLLFEITHAYEITGVCPGHAANIVEVK